MADSPTIETTTDAPAPTSAVGVAPTVIVSPPATVPAPAAAPAPAAPVVTTAPAPAAPATGDGGKGEGNPPDAELLASQARIRDLETQLRDAKSQAGRAKTVEERLALLETELAESKAEVAKGRAEKRRDTALKDILAKLPASRHTEAEPTIVGLASLHGIDLSAEDRDATVKAVHALIEQRHPSMLKELDARPSEPFPHLHKVSNAAPEQRGAPGLVNGLDGRPRQVI